MRSARDYIIFPLDVSSVNEARSLVQILSPHVGLFKIGLELFIRSGPDFIHWIQENGSVKIFLDLKFHDIPATVSNAMAGISELGISFTTIHCGENPMMLKAAVDGANGKVGVLGVTVLTSVSRENILTAGFCPEYGKDPNRLVIKRAEMARNAGCCGVVCSGLEVSAIKQRFGTDFIAVTPGIRPLWDKVSDDDQSRITTPTQAIQNGADYLVIGRPIRQASDPIEAVQRIADEITNSLLL